MGLLKKILGICRTRLPQDGACWQAEGDTVRVALDRAPELSGTEGAMRIEGRGLARRVLVYRGADGGYEAVVNRCTHMGRRLDPTSDGAVLGCCSLSGSRFDAAGNPIAGPAKNPLTRLPVEQSGNTLTIQLSR